MMKTINATHYEPKEKHKKIFEMYFSLEIGESMLLINDHDPKPLYYQFVFEHQDQFEWTYQNMGPDLFEVIIKKIA
ncbi:MAG: hemerythrin [Tenericutes bacterium HGW-Tenericutes-6]|nr:MAG: hemerythrin [Tenericutes bacterium HGW-Tenericutes-6]